MLNKELQDQAWATLPKEFKEEVKTEWLRALSRSDQESELIKRIFGHHNLTSDAEPQPETQKKAKENETAFASDTQNMDDKIIQQAWCEYRGMEYVEGHVRPLPSDNFEKGFRMAVDKIMALPLEQRLTAEERSYIKKLYMAADVSSTDFSRGYKAAINCIFGADMCHNKSNSNESMD